jgi:aldose sugar dehydrogenase
MQESNGNLKLFETSRETWALALCTVLTFLCFACPRSFAQRDNGAGIRVLGTRPPDKAPVAGQPLETREPIGIGQKPAFAGQTRAISVVTKTPYIETVITDGLNQPWSFAFLPDGKVLVAEKPGAMRIVNPETGKVEREVMGVPQVKYGGDAGLLDVVLDPNFATNRMIYFTYVEPRGPVYSDGAMPFPQQDNGLNVAKAKLGPDNRFLQNVTTILRVEPSIPTTAHYGGRLLFDKEGYLFVSTSERFFYPTRGQAQSLFSLLGKILRITTDGKPAPGNPFDKNQELEDHPRPEIWSYGHRNPQGMAIHPVTGDLWESEHGPQGGDEINLIQSGRNYGWPIIAYGSNYDGTKIDGTLAAQDGMLSDFAGRKPELNGGALTAITGMEQPVYYWDPTIAPSGMIFYDGKLIPEWKNNLFVAGLAGQHVSRLIFAGNRVVGEERLLLDQHQRMRDVQEGPDGALWIVTDDADGRLIRIAPKQ